MKRLSKTSKQGLDEFKNEVFVHSKTSAPKPCETSGMQHRGRGDAIDL